MFGTRASFFVDLFLLLLVLILPAIWFGAALARRGRIREHATVMVTCFVLFLAAVVVFEVDVQFLGEGVPLATVPLAIHLCLAFPTLALWIWQVATARRARSDPRAHRARGRALLAVLTATVATGIWLYVETFV